MLEIELTVGRVRLRLGSPGGTRADPADDPAPERAADLRRALDRSGEEPLPDAARVAEAIERADDVTADVERATRLVEALARGATLDPAILQTQVNGLLDALERADREGRWEDELRLARSLVSLLALVPRWLALAETLRRALAAAHLAGDRAAEAWARHELGTFSLAADDAHAATGHLQEALRTRERLGDEVGAEASRRNLELAAAGLGGGRPPRSLVALGVVAAVVILAGGLAVAGGLVRGGDEPSFAVTDGTGTAATGTTDASTGTTTAANAPPAALDLVLPVSEDEPAEWRPDVTDADGDALACSLAEEAAAGTATVEDDCGRGAYTPAADFSGADRFVYAVADGRGGEDSATVSVEVEPVNDAPQAGGVEISTKEGAVAGWLPDVRDVDDERLACSVVQEPEGGAASVSDDCSAGTYQPSPDFTGEDTFVYRVADAAGASADAVVTAIVEEVDEPVIE